MNTNAFVQYYILSLDGKVPELKCKVDEEHMSLVPFFDINDELTLRCYACNYILRPGLKLYEEITKLLDGIENV
jgi:hypothetical protein